MKKITLLFALIAFSMQSYAQSTINIETTGGLYVNEKWVSITTGVDGSGTQVWGQGDGNQCNNAGLINQNINIAPGTYYVNCYDAYDDGWDGTLISVTAYGAVIGDNGGVTPDDGTDTDANGSCEATAEELEASFMIVVPTAPCDTPVADFMVVSNCPTDSTFTITVNVTDIGSASGVTISDDQGSSNQMGGIAMYTFGPYANATNVTISVANGDNAICVFGSPVLTYNVPCPPLNDLCADAFPVDCGDAVSGSTVNGTDSGGNTAFDVWYSYSGVAGDITLSLCESTYDTYIRVLDSCGGTEIAGNDDSCGPTGSTIGNRSSVTFTADGTSTYYIMIEGYGGYEGTYNMTVTCAGTVSAPSNDECINAEALMFATSVTGTTAGATENLTEEKATCDIFGNMADVWYTLEITAGTSDLTLATTLIGSTDQANIAVYSACGGLQSDSLGCDDTGEVAGETLTITGLANGTYYVRVWSDGIAARNSQRVEGEFSIVADATLSTQDINANGLAFTYYPNPVSSALTLKSQKDIENVSVYNMLGQEVLRTAPNAVNTEVNMSALQSGAYFVKVTIGSVTETVRIIKN